ncbi:hypothetical protein C4D60_Mb05t09680 [Musa balbisiana]|uniref:RRM domain-containing protein n=1 Tax=Musa balbisiana TaxID=52838 RepID=A0A4S8JUX0_MUSBA|nr:hypothetical protein C4D60_Mb05t09680 [Musa balbisiana]
MAEGERRGGGERGEESVKLFVGQVPKQMAEEELRVLFKEVALVDEVSIIKDKVTKASRGCCFLICPSREEADKAVAAYHNKRTLPGVWHSLPNLFPHFLSFLGDRVQMLWICISALVYLLEGASSPMQVKYADGELERLEHKLFIGMIPKNVSDAEVAALFSKYGCAFLKYETKEQSLAALEALNGKHRMEGSSVPLVVKWADTEKERQARRAQKAQSQASSLAHGNSMHQPSIFGALPMGYIPPYNGYGYQQFSCNQLVYLEW